MSILLVLTTKLNFTAPISTTLSVLTNPIISPLTYLRLQNNDFLNYLVHTPSLARENEKLKNENNVLRVKAKKLTDLISDQNQLKSLNQNTWQSQPVKLVSLDNLATFTSLDFAKIRPGQPVATGNSLVGLVKSVEPPIIKVIPLSHPDAKLPIQLDTGAKGDYVFKNTGPHIINLATNASFNSKTTVFTLPSATIPENLILGQIDKITTNTANPTQEATVILDTDISKAHDFFVITKP